MSNLSEPRFVLAQVQAAGKNAGQSGLPHSDNPHGKGTREELSWFETWHIATVEREEGIKILSGLPDSASGLLMFRPERKEESEL